MASAPTRVAVIVLAGGQARRFGSDKLAADVDGRALLELALDGVPDDDAVSVAVVGPARRLGRDVTVLREDPPGGGPAAALITGLGWALTTEVEAVVTLPGDAPGGGRAAMLLLTELERGQRDIVVGIDGSGRDQVLQLALRPAAARLLIGLAGPHRGHDQSVRRLVTAAGPARLLLPDDLSADIDTADQLEHFRNLHRT
ncbi:MAG TPA: NTP transferase domain-containing protein [Microlunatus sp.]|jgi:molybdopterin-guanine dinucleotide biosynthesis protein A|nr:NTP transferase domain-containing protein [Microlunatus sp.]